MSITSPEQCIKKLTRIAAGTGSRPGTGTYPSYSLMPFKGWQRLEWPEQEAEASFTAFDSGLSRYR